MSVRDKQGRREPNAKAPRCCWLSSDQRMCRNKATQRKIIFSDPNHLSRDQWFWIPVCDKHR